MRDFGAFVYLLGYRDLGAFHKDEITRISKVRLLTDTPVRRLWLWSRGFFKTSLLTEAHTVWLIVNNPDIRVLVVSYSLEVAKKPLGAIRNHFIGNEDFRYFFREYCPKPNKEGKIEWGTTEAITIPNRTRNLKEPTVMCAGVGTNITGLHFDYMKIDDLVNKDSVTNDTQVQASKDYYSLLRPIFDNPTIPREDVIGTIYHYNDLHSLLKENPLFEKSFIPAHIDGRFVFPERLDEKGWDSLNSDKSLSPYDIQRQWLLRPVNPKDAVFKEEWLKYYDSLPEGLKEYVLCDPASTQKKKSDYTVIERWGVDGGGNCFLLEGIRDRLSSFDRVDSLFTVVSHAKDLAFVKYEVLGGRHGDLEVIAQKQRKEQRFFLVKETKSATISKEDRIRQRLQGAYHSGAIHLPRTLVFKSKHDGRTYDFVELLRREYLEFPFTEHDDILDCQSQMFEEELIPGKRVRNEEKKKWGTADDWDRMYADLDKMRSQNPFSTNETVMQKLRVRRFKRAVLHG